MRKAQNIQKWLNRVIIASEASHIFCCVLPTVFSVISVLAGIGMVSAMPFWLDGLHEVMHDWEVPMLMTAGAVLVFGWGLHWLTLKLDSHSEHCHHGGCDSKKKNKSGNLILKIATVLFLINITVYFGLHRGQDAAKAEDHHVHAEHHDNHGHHP